MTVANVDETTTQNIGTPNRRELSARATKDLLISTALEMVFESPVELRTESVKVTDVVRRVGLSPGALYHHWETQELFRDAVRDAIRNQNYFCKVPPPADQATYSGTVEDVMITLARGFLQDNLGNPAMQVFLGQWAQNGPGDREHLHRHFSETNQAWSELIEDVLHTKGREIVPSITPKRLLELVTSFLLGFHVLYETRHQSNLSPETAWQPQIQPEELEDFDHAVRVLIDGFTRPIPTK